MVIGVLLLPAFQTWYTTHTLDKNNIKDVSIGFVSASFGKLALEDINIKKEGLSLTIPNLEANVSVLDALNTKHAHIKGIVAKGWVLDLSNNKISTLSLNTLSNTLKSIIETVPFPFDFDIQGIVLDGQIILPASNQHPPVHTNIRVTSGSIDSKGHGELTFNLSSIFGDPDLLLNGAQVEGISDFQIDSSKKISKFTIKANAVPTGSGFSRNESYSIILNKRNTNLDTEFKLVIGSQDKTICEFNAHANFDFTQVEGSWSIKANQSVLANLLPDKTLPFFTTEGSGTFAYVKSQDQWLVKGKLQHEFNQLERVATALAPFNHINAIYDFYLLRDSKKIIVQNITGFLLEANKIASYHTLEPITINTDTVSLADNLIDKNLLEITFIHMPVARLSPLTNPVLLSGTEVTGNLALRRLKTGYTLLTLSKFNIPALTLKIPGNNQLTALSVTGQFDTQISSDGLHYVIKSLEFNTKNAPLLKLSGEAFRALDPESTSTFKVTGVGKLTTLKSYFKDSFIEDIQGDLIEYNAAGSSNLNSSTIESHITLFGLADHTSFTFAPHIDFFPNNTQSLFLPITVKRNNKVSDITIECSLNHEQNMTSFEAKLFGDYVVTEDLSLLSPWLSFKKELLNKKSVSNKRLWGNLSGKVITEFAHLETPSRNINQFAATFEFDPKSIHMHGARGIFPDTHSFTADGTLEYKLDKITTYTLLAHATMNELPSADFLSPLKQGLDSSFEGKFSFDADIISQGESLSELYNHSTKTLHLHSTSGIVRLLKVNIGDTIPQNTSVVSDTLGSVSQKLGSFFQLKDHLEKYRNNEVSQNAENIISLTNDLAEIGYDSFKLNAIISQNGSIELNSLDLVSSDIHLSGYGTIAATQSSFTDEPLDLKLKLQAKGKIAQTITKAHLATVKDTDQGFTQFNQTIEIKGTLNKPDNTQWHDLLGKAANAPDTAGAKAEKQKLKIPKETEESRTLQDSELGLLPQ